MWQDHTDGVELVVAAMALVSCVVLRVHALGQPQAEQVMLYAENAAGAWQTYSEMETTGGAAWAAPAVGLAVSAAALLACWRLRKVK